MFTSLPLNKGNQLGCNEFVQFYGGVAVTIKPLRKVNANSDEVLDRIVCVCLSKNIPIQKIKFPSPVQSSRYDCVVPKWEDYDRGEAVTQISKAKQVHTTPCLSNSLACNGPSSPCVCVCVRDRNHRNALLWSVLSVGSACESCLVITGCSENAQSYLLTHQKIAPWW